MKSSLDIVGIRLIEERKIISERRIASPQMAVEVLANELKWLDREMVLMLNFNINLEIINAHVISVGRVDSTVVDVKSIFKSALLSNASSLMLIHNHPSGDCKPSIDDLRTTGKIKKACELMDMRFIDHIVIGRNKYYSIEGRIENDYEKETKSLDYNEEAVSEKNIEDDFEI